MRFITEDGQDYEQVKVFGLCPLCHAPVVYCETYKFIWWGDLERGLRPMWRVAHEGTCPLPPTRSVQ